MHSATNILWTTAWSLQLLVYIILYVYLSYFMFRNHAADSFKIHVCCGKAPDRPGLEHRMLQQLQVPESYLLYFNLRPVQRRPRD